MEVREVLQAARLRAGLTQDQVAKALGKNQFWLSNRETGKTGLSLEDAVLLSGVLNLTDDEWVELRRLVTA